MSRLLPTRVWILCLYVSGPLVFLLTDPGRLPLPFLVFPFLWLFATLFVSVVLVGRWRVPEFPRRRLLFLASLLATLPVLLLVFDSIHQLSLRDVLLSVGIIVVAGVYLFRADFIR